MRVDRDAANREEAAWLPAAFANRAIAVPNDLDAIIRAIQEQK